MSFDSYLPPGMGIDDLIVVVASLSSLSVLLLVWFALAPVDKGAKRARMLAEQRKAMKAGVAGPVRRQNKERVASTNFMHDVVGKLQLMKSSQAEKTAIKLLRAGWRDKDALVYYLFFKLLLPFVIGGVAVVATFVFDAYSLDLTQKMAVCVGAVVLGAYLPDLIIKNQATKRREKLGKSTPDALDLMVICAEAGLSLDATLSRVSKEMENTDPELSEELSLTSLELGFLPDRRKALTNLGLRTDLSVLRSLTNTLMQAERYGTPLAGSLRVMAAESRDERIMKAEEKAARLPAMLTVPMIIFIMPPLFVVLIGPAIISTIDALRGI